MKLIYYSVWVFILIILFFPATFIVEDRSDATLTQQSSELKSHGRIPASLHEDFK